MLPRDRSRLVPCRWPASLRFLAPVVPTKQLLSAQGVASRSTPFYRVWETRAARNSAYTILESGNGVTKGWIFCNPCRLFLSNGTRNTYPIRTIRRAIQIDGYSRRLAASSIDETSCVTTRIDEAFDLPDLPRLLARLRPGYLVRWQAENARAHRIGPRTRAPRRTEPRHRLDIVST